MLVLVRTNSNLGRFASLLSALALAIVAIVAGDASTARAGAGGLPAGFSVGKADAPDPVVTGSLLTYTVIVTNNTGSTATNVSLHDRLPRGALTGVSAVSSQGTCSVTVDNVVCAIGTLEQGQSATVTITGTVTAPAGSVLLNRALARATVNGMRVEAEDNEFTTVVADGGGGA